MDTQLILVAIAGAFAQLIDGSLGMGFGVSSASLLAHLGFAPAVVSASVHVAKLTGGLASGAAHLRMGNVDARVVAPLAVSGSVGAAAGASLLLVISGAALRPLVAAGLLVLGVRVFWKFYRQAGADEHVTSRVAAKRPSRVKLTALGFIGGAIDAMGGGGWGPVCTPALASDDTIGPRKAIGSVNLAEVAVAATVVVILGAGMRGKGVPWAVVGMLVLGGIAVAPLAAWACSRLPAATLGMTVGALLVSLNTHTLLSSMGPIEVRFSLSPGLLGALVALALALAVALRWRRMAEKVERS